MNDVIKAAEAWSNNWAWSLPLIASTVLVHAIGLVLIQKYIVLRLPVRGHQSIVAFASVAVASAVLLTVLLEVEAGAWAAAYLAVRAP